MDVIITITCYMLPIDCLLIALDAYMFSHNGYGIYAAQLRPGRWASVEEWLQAELLTTE